MAAQAAQVDNNKRITRTPRNPNESREATNGGAISAEDALKIAQETIARQEAENTELRQTARKADVQVANTTVARVQDRAVMIDNALAAANAAQEAANAAWRTAKANEDIDAEAKALDLLADAKMEVKTWTSEKTKFEAEKPQILAQAKRVVETPDQSGPSAESKKWLEDHPLYYSDATYKQDALDAHAAAMARGLQAGTTGYITAINETLSRLHGANHGKTKSEKRMETSDRGSSSAAPPGRESDGSTSSSGLRLTKNADGSKNLIGDIPANWVDAAKWNGMSDVEYAVSMLEAEEEAKAGRGQVVQMGDGAVYR